LIACWWSGAGASLPRRRSGRRAGFCQPALRAEPCRGRTPEVAGKRHLTRAADHCILRFGRLGNRTIFWCALARQVPFKWGAEKRSDCPFFGRKPTVQCLAVCARPGHLRRLRQGKWCRWSIWPLHRIARTILFVVGTTIGMARGTLGSRSAGHGAPKAPTLCSCLCSGPGNAWADRNFPVRSCVTLCCRVEGTSPRNRPCPPSGVWAGNLRLVFSSDNPAGRCLRTPARHE